MLFRVGDRELRRCGELSTATRRWQPAEARGSRGACAGGHQGRGTELGRKRATRGSDPSRRWRCGGGEALPAAEPNRAGPTCGRKKKRGERSGGLV
jgi:hypothetical protein